MPAKLHVSPGNTRSLWLYSVCVGPSVLVKYEVRIKHLLDSQPFAISHTTILDLLRISSAFILSFSCSLYRPESQNRVNSFVKPYPLSNETTGMLGRDSPNGRLLASCGVSNTGVDTNCRTVVLT